jgi:hypothetical protein
MNIIFLFPLTFLGEHLVRELTHPPDLCIMSGMCLPNWTGDYCITDMVLFAKLFESIIRFSV